MLSPATECTSAVSKASFSLQGRKDGRQVRGEHGLARTRRAAHQHAVIACGRYLQRAFCRLVARHVAEIGHALLPAQRVGARRLELPRHAGPRANAASSGAPPPPPRGRPTARSRARIPASRAHSTYASDPATGRTAPSSEARRRRAGLRRSRRSTWPVAASRPTAMGRSKPEPVFLRAPAQVHHHLLAGHGEPAGAQGRPHALPRLLDGRVGHADHQEARQAGRDHHLHVHRQRLHAPQRGALHSALAEHGLTRPRTRRCGAGSWPGRAPP